MRKCCKYRFIYILRSGESDLYKIGFTISLGRRVRELQVGNPEVISVEYHVLAPARSELGIYDDLSQYHYRGEWYKLSRESVQALKDRFKKYEEMVDQSILPGSPMYQKTIEKVREYVSKGIGITPKNIIKELKICDRSYYNYKAHAILTNQWPQSN